MDSPVTSLRSPPNSASTTGTRRSRFFLPLSNHGMPKTPLPTSPGGSIRSHRFKKVTSPQMSPGSPLSPSLPTPMSAKSFSTFIESEPSTPAYSPHASSSAWDSSTLVLLSPVSSAPSSPPEPKWEMMKPTPSRKPSLTPTNEVSAPKLTSEISPQSSLCSHPVRMSEEESQKENMPPPAVETTAEVEAEPKSHEEESAQPASLGKLATRMKSILRRKTVSEKKVKSRRNVREDLDRMEDVHWTEM